MTTTRIPIAFAQDGNRTAMDLTRPDGVVNLTQGYTDDYSRQLGSDPAAKAIERDRMNWLFNVITGNIIDWQQSAVPQYLAQTQYAVPALVRFAPSGTVENIYRAIATPPVGTVPSNTDYWEEVISISALRALIPMPFRGVVSNPTDFNSFVTNGTWVMSTVNVGATYPNSPGNAVSGMLEVRLTTGDAQALVQRYTDTGGGIYTRGRNAAGAWTAWITSTFPVPIAQGGTGATTAAQARTNLGLGTAATYNVGTAGNVVPVLANGNTWGGIQIIAGNSGTLQLTGAGAADRGSIVFGVNGSYLNYNGSAYTFYNASTGQSTNITGGGSTWTTGNFDPGTKVNKAGDVMTGGLDVRAEFLVSPTGATQARIVGDTANVYWDSRASAGSTTPNGGAAYRASVHRWTDSGGNVRTTLDGSGNYTTTGVIQGTSYRAYGGSVGVQQGVLARGWSNAVTRWLDVIEGDGSLSLYSYNSAGAGGVQLVNFKSVSAGGTNTTNFSGEVASTGRIVSNESGFISYGTAAAFTAVERTDYAVTWSLYASGGTFRVWNSVGGDIASFNRTNGNMVINGSMNAAGYDVGSSPKLKDIDGWIPYGLREVRAVRKLIGSYKGAYSADQSKRLFFDADHMVDWMPELVNIGAIDFGGEKVNSIRTEGVGPVAFNAISELADETDERIEQLKRDNSRLQEMVERLERRLDMLEGGA